MTKLISHKIFFTAAILSGCFFLWGCENDVNEVRELGRKKENIEEGKNISSYLSMDGKMRAHLTAPLMLRIQGDTGRRTEFPRSLHVDFYNDSTAQIESQLSALYGNYLENQNKVFLRDSVVAFNVKGDTLFCKEMYWDQNLQKFYTDKEVTISQRYPKKRFSGVGMTCNQDLTNLTLFKIQPGSFAMIADSLANGTDTTRK
ncbi:MAG TPA: LPS export ABC transporter periplasmic protein LptC [Sediminibacterium sp.]